MYLKEIPCISKVTIPYLTVASILGDNMLVYLSLDLICSSKRTPISSSFTYCLCISIIYVIAVNGATVSKQQH